MGHRNRPEVNTGCTGKLTTGRSFTEVPVWRLLGICRPMRITFWTLEPSTSAPNPLGIPLLVLKVASEIGSKRTLFRCPEGCSMFTIPSERVSTFVRCTRNSFLCFPFSYEETPEILVDLNMIGCFPFFRLRFVYLNVARRWPNNRRVIAKNPKNDYNDALSTVKNIETTFS